jgi:hypothetical protein
VENRTTQMPHGASGLRPSRRRHPPGRQRARAKTRRLPKPRPARSLLRPRRMPHQLPQQGQRGRARSRREP